MPGPYCDNFVQWKASQKEDPWQNQGIRPPPPCDECAEAAALFSRAASFESSADRMRHRAFQLIHTKHPKEQK